MTIIEASLDIKKKTQLQHQLPLIMVNDVLDIKGVSAEKVSLILFLVSASWYWISTLSQLCKSTQTDKGSSKTLSSGDDSHGGQNTE